MQRPTNQGVGSSTRRTQRAEGRRRAAAAVPSAARDSWPKAANNLSGRARIIKEFPPTGMQQQARPRALSGATLGVSREASYPYNSRIRRNLSSGAGLWAIPGFPE